MLKNVKSEHKIRNWLTLPTETGMMKEHWPLVGICC